jgi:fumarate hydratase class II
MNDMIENYRIEHDSMGDIRVALDKLWGAQTQRSYENFRIGEERMPREIIRAFALLKKACAVSNLNMGKLSREDADAISAQCDKIANGEYTDQFPLVVWQTGSGTQTNMNVNEVIAHLAAKEGVSIHPNDHANMSQSSNDTYPSALHIAMTLAIRERLLPAIDQLRNTLLVLEKRYADTLKIGRTHLQDATPLTFGQEISAWRTMLEENKHMIESSLEHLKMLAIGGTAVGTGLNAPRGFDAEVCRVLTEISGTQFAPDPNKFHALTSKDACVFAHGALKALAANLMKIANDVRWLAGGPRCGLAEITIPANEAGSSIMPGKVNPTQCEAVTMVAVQVMGNDATIGFAASQGNFQLNVFLPVCAYNALQSIRLLADCMASFEANCIRGISANEKRMREYLDNSLMLCTCLSPKLGYEATAKIAKHAFLTESSLKEAAIASGLIEEKVFNEMVDPKKMV